MSKKCIYNAAVKRAKELNKDLIDNHPIGVAVKYNYDLPSSERFRDAVGRLRPTMRELNSEFKAKNFGQIATLNTALSDGVGINITVLPAMELAYDYKNGKLTPKEFREEYEKEINRTPDNFLKNQERERPRGFYMGDRALEEQERRNDELNSIDIIPSDPAGVAELFESNPELANSIYEALGFTGNITQDDKSYYRGQIEEPIIDKDGNLILYGREDELYKRAGLKSKGVSMTDDLQSAIEYGNGQLDVAMNLASETYDRDIELERLSTEGYWLIQIPKNTSNEIVKEAGEVKVIGDKIIIPKGQYKIEQVVEGLEAQITPQQKQPNNTVQDLSGNTYSANESDITTYETEFGPIRYITNENGDMVMLSDKNTDTVENQITPQQKQEAQQLYSQYLEQNPNGSVEQFKSWVDEFNTNKYLQLASNLTNPAIEELDNFLLDFLKNFNVKSKQFEELKSRLGVNALGATDVLNKLIWYTKNRNEETLPEEAAHMLVALMGENHPDVKELLTNITNWSEYKSIKDQYLPIYKNEEKVKIEAVGKLISKSLVKNYKASGLNKNKLQKALDNIIEYIENILDGLNISDVFFYNENIADHIATNVLSGNKDYIYKITNQNSDLNAQKEIENNPNAKSVIKRFSSKNVKMTGSLAIAGTENIRRPEGQGIHDLDFRVKSFEVFDKEVLSKLPENAVPAHYGWHKKTYSTYAYLIPSQGYRIEVLERKDDFSNGWITDYRLYNEKNEQVEITQQNVMSVDFFVYKEGANQKDFDFSSEFIPASLVYEGKISLGGKTNPYFFSRDKDQEDYVLRNPKSFIPFEEHIYYQLDDTLSDFISQKSQERLNQVQEVFNENPELSSIGTPEQYSNYLNTIFPDSQVKDIVYHSTSNVYKLFRDGVYSYLDDTDDGKIVLQHRQFPEKTLEVSEKEYVNEFLKAKQDPNFSVRDINHAPTTISNAELGTGFYVSSKLDNIPNSDGINSNIYPMVVNVVSPYNVKGYGTEVSNKSNKPLIDNGFDSVVTTIRGGKEIAVFDKSQTHVLGSQQDIEGFKDFTQGEQFQKLTAEEKAKTIGQITKEHRSITALKALAAKLAHRIGGRVRFENRIDVDWKGYNQGMTSVLNEAYMTPDTPFHEILAHPIIRAIKNRNLNKVKVDEHGGKEFIYKGDIYKKEEENIFGFPYKNGETISNSDFDSALNQYLKEGEDTELYQSLLKELETGRGKEVFEQVKRDYKYKTDSYRIEKSWGGQYSITNSFTPDISYGIFKTIEEAQKELDKIDAYTLEDQQEEALVTLLGMMAADKLDAKKDATLISKLKELWGQIFNSVKSLLEQDGIKINELPITTTLNDLAEIMAYGDNKIILPGYKIEYQTPLGNKYETLEEVDNEIRGLADANVEVDLSNIEVNYAETIDDVPKKNFTYYELADSFSGDTHEIRVLYNPENKKGWFMVHPYEGELYPLKDETVVNYYNNHGLKSFIEKNKEYEQSREIIEEYKKENNIQYDPEEVYSRGQEFYHIQGAYFNSARDTELWVQGLLGVLDDYERAGTRMELSFATAPQGEVGKGMRGMPEARANGTLVYITAYPQSEDIIMASKVDNNTSSFGHLDGLEKGFTNRNNVVTGIALTKSVPLSNINTIEPNLADTIDDVAHHNESVIALTKNNFRIHYGENVAYEVKQIIDKFNKILDDKYGKLEKPKITSSNFKYYTIERISGVLDSDFTGEYTYSEAKNKIKQLEEKHKGNKYTFIENSRVTGKQPTQTRENTTSIESVKSKLDKENYEKFGGQEAEEGMEFIYPEKHNKKEYTSQALTNLKVAALKEVARKYPRSLVTSKVVPIDPNLVDNSERQYSKVGTQEQSEVIPLFPAQPSKLIADNSQNQKEITQEQIDTEITVAKDSEIREVGILEEELGTEAATIVSTNPETREGGEYYSIDIGDENEMNTSVDENADFSEYLNSRIELLNTVENKIKKLHRNRNRSEKENTLLTHLVDMQEALQEEISDNVDSNKEQVVRSLHNEIDALVSLIEELNSTNDPTEVMLKLEANQFFERLEFVSQLLDDRDSNDRTYFHDQLLKGFSDGESIYNKLFTEVNQATKKFENSVVNYMINLVLSEDTWIDIKKSAIANATNDSEAEKRVQEIEDKIKEIIEDPENIYIDNDSKLAAGFVVPSNMYNSLMADFIYVTRNNIEKTEKQKLSSARNTINTVFKKIEDIRLPNGETLQEALFEKNRFGGRTQRLIRPLSSFWYGKTFPKIRGAIKDFQTSLYLRDGNTEDTYRDMIESLQANGDILILQKIPSVAKKYKDSPELSEFFTYTYSEMAEYEKRMIEHYGETAYRKILAESERSLSNFVNDPETVQEFRHNMNPLAFIKHFYSANPKGVNEATGNFNNPKYNYIMPKYGDKRYINDEFAAIENQGIQGFKESYSALEESLEYISNTFPDETSHTSVPNLIHNTTRETLNHWRYTRNWNPNLLRFLNIITDRFSKYLDNYAGALTRNEYETKNKKGQDLVAKNFSSYGRKSIKSSMEILQHAPFKVLEEKAKELGLSIPADYSDSEKDRKQLAEAIATASVTKTSELNIRVRMNAALEIAESYNTRLETNKVIEFVKTFLKKKGAKNTYDYVSGQQEVNVHKNGFRSISSMIRPNFSDRDVALSRLDPSDPDYQLPNKKKVKRLSPAEKEVKKLLEEEKENLYGWNISFTFQGVEYYVDKETKKPHKKTYEGENLDEEVNVPMIPEEFENVYKKYFEARLSQLGKGVTTSSILQGLGANVSAVYLRLNFLAGYGNRLQGKFQNNMGAASGLNGYDTYSLFLARKFLNFKNTDKMLRLYAKAPEFLFTKKKRQQMEILNMIIDNFHLVEQQFDLDVGKDQFLAAISQQYANFASDLSVNNPEDQNQSELLLAMFINLKIEKIVGQNADGSNKTEMVPFFDPDTFTFPYETDGSLTLKPEFQTQTNIENWQSGGKGGEQSSFFMNRYKNNRDRLHGAYAENQKSNIRNNIFGELAMKFKPWMVANLFNEYGYKTIDYSTGTLDKKGRSLPFLEHPTVGITHLLASNLAGNGTLTGSAIMAIAPILGLSGAMSVAIPAVLGVTMLGTGYFGYQYLKKRKNIVDSQKTNMQAEIRLTASYALETFQRILQTTARHIPLHKFDTTKGLLNTDKAIDFALTKNAGISEADRRLMSEKSQLVADKLLLGVTTLIGSRLIAAMLESLFIDDDDDDEKREHQEKEITQYLNAYLNVMNGAMTNQNMWEDPIAIFSSAASLPVERFVYGSVTRVTRETGKALDGKSTWEEVGWKTARSVSEYGGVPSTLRKIADGTLLKNPRSYNRGWYGEEETRKSYRTEDRNLAKELDDNRGRFKVNVQRVANKKLREMFPDLEEYKREDLASKVLQRFLREQGAYNPDDPKKAIEEVDWDTLVEKFEDYELPLTEEGELIPTRKKKKKKRRKKKSGGSSLGTSL